MTTVAELLKSIILTKDITRLKNSICAEFNDLNNSSFNIVYWKNIVKIVEFFFDNFTALQVP